MRIKHNFKTLKDTKEILFYKDGYYHFGGDTIIEEEAERTFANDMSTYYANEICNHVRRSTYIDRSKVNGDIFLLNLKNGIYNIEDNAFTKHTPDFITTIRIPIIYNPDAKGPNGKKFIKDVTKNKQDAERLEEVAGDCLYRLYITKAASVLIGGGDNGKTIFLLLLRMMLGDGNYSNVSLETLEKDRFSLSYLYGKMANFYSELSDKSLKYTNDFKMLTGGDPIQTSAKFGKEFTYINHAKLVFATNNLPYSFDNTDAFFGRWNSIDFIYKFVDNPKLGTNEKQKDPNILAKITTDEELSAFFNVAVKGLKRILKKKEFSYTKTPEEARDDYKRKSSSVYAFYKEWCEVAKDGIITKSELYDVYLQYCRYEHKNSLGQIKFGKAIRGEAPLADIRRTIDGKQHEAWKGIKFNAEYLTNHGMEDDESEGDEKKHDIFANGKDPLEELMKEKAKPDLNDLVKEAKGTGEPNNGNGRKNKDFLYWLEILKHQNPALNISVLKQEAKSKEISLKELCRIKYVGTYNEVQERMK